MTLLRPFWVLVLALSTYRLFAAPAVPLVNLVDEQALFVVSVTDAPALVRSWGHNPVATTLSDPQVVRFLAPLRKHIGLEEWDGEIRAATGMSLRELVELAQGEVLVAVPSLSSEEFKASDTPPVLVAVEVGDGADKLKSLLAKSVAEKSLKEESETFAGTVVTTTTLPAEDDAVVKKDDTPEEPAARPISISWAIDGGVWFVSAEKARVQAALDAFKQGGVATALGKSERYIRTRQRVGEAQALVYLNLPAIYPILRDAITTAKAAPDGGINALGLDPEVAFNALALDSIGEAFVALTTGDKQSRIDAGLFYSDERGLMKLLAYQPGSAPRPDWIPAKWPSVSTARFSIPKFYEGLEQLIGGISPMFGIMAQGQIRNLNKQLRIDLKRDLIGSFGEEIISAHAFPPGAKPDSVPAWTEMDQLVAISLTNEQAFAKSIDALKQLAGPSADKMFNKREYLGGTIYTLNLQPAAPGMRASRGFSYAIGKGTLLLGLGSPASVESALQGMNAPEGAFWSREDVKTALASVPTDASGLQVQDMRVMVASIVEAAVQYQCSIDEQVGSEEEKKVYFDLEARPDAEVIARHWGMAGGYATRASDGIFSTTILAHPQK